MTIPQQANDPVDTPEPVGPRGIPSRGRAWLAAALVFVGGYLVMSSLAGSLAGALAGFSGGPFVVLHLVAQLLFALVVVVVGLIGAPGSTVGKLVGAFAVVVGVAIVLAVTVARLSGALRFGAEAWFFIANPWLTTVLLVGAAWLLVRRARLGWLSLLGIVVLSPTAYWLFLAGAEAGLVPLVMQTLSAVVGAGILLAGRPWRD